MTSTYQLARLVIIQLDQYGQLDWQHHETSTELVRTLAERVVELHDTAELLADNLLLSENLAENLLQLRDLQSVLREEHK